LEKHLKIVVQELIESGFKINLKKSQLQTSEIVNHMGFTLNSQEGKLEITAETIKSVRKNLGKFLTKSMISKRQAAAILGQIRANLLSLPFSGAFTTLLVSFLASKNSAPWGSKHPVPQELKNRTPGKKTFIAPVVRQTFCGEASKNFTFRFQRPGLGGGSTPKLANSFKNIGGTSPIYI
jgi:hypothetical protein